MNVHTNKNRVTSIRHTYNYIYVSLNGIQLGQNVVNRLSVYTIKRNGRYSNIRWLKWNKKWHGGPEWCIFSVSTWRGYHFLYMVTCFWRQYFCLLIKRITEITRKLMTHLLKLFLVIYIKLNCWMFVLA